MVLANPAHMAGPTLTAAVSAAPDPLPRKHAA